MNADRYRTLGGRSAGIHRMLASKFIGYAFPIPNEEAFRTEAERIAKEHPTARHHCYGWVLDNTGGRFRASDDGEPNGTAGKPILRQLQALDLTYCAVVVVRYFGGTLLGKPGLIHAYGETARLALAEASIIERVVMERWTLECGYDRFDVVKSDILLNEGIVVECTFTERCSVEFELPIGHLPVLEAKWGLLGIRVAPR
ncbi:MAG TPA: YigZ family protein [Flavobacteriales bacterium]|nr:YigZ family protein [Flavobacteriales bacterium]